MSPASKPPRTGQRRHALHPSELHRNYSRLGKLVGRMQSTSLESERFFVKAEALIGKSARRVKANPEPVPQYISTYGEALWCLRIRCLRGDMDRK